MPEQLSTWKTDTQSVGPCPVDGPCTHVPRGQTGGAAPFLGSTRRRLLRTSFLTVGRSGADLRGHDHQRLRSRSHGRAGGQDPPPGPMKQDSRRTQRSGSRGPGPVSIAGTEENPLLLLEVGRKERPGTSPLPTGCALTPPGEGTPSYCSPRPP